MTVQLYNNFTCANVLFFLVSYHLVLMVEKVVSYPLRSTIPINWLDGARSFVFAWLLVFGKWWWFSVNLEVSFSGAFIIFTRLLTFLFIGWKRCSSARVRDLFDSVYKVNFRWVLFQKYLLVMCFWFTFFRLKFSYSNFEFEYSTVSWEVWVVFTVLVILSFSTRAV